MRRWTSALVVALQAGLVTAGRAAAQQPAPEAGARPPRPALRAVRTDAAIRLDGLLDEPSWLTADSIAGLVQQEPDEGAPERDRTVVRVLSTEAGLYLGLWAYQDPGTIVRAYLTRDADLEPDDVFVFLFDPQQDRRSAYAFAVNPNCALADGEVKGPEDVAMDWNGVWDARCRLTSDGWQAEIFVPWQTLRYRRDGGAWGFNVMRQVRHRNEFSLWTSWQRQFGLFYLPGAGTLEGLGPLPGRRLVEARPYAAATAALDSREYRADGLDSVTGRAELDPSLGLDAKLALAPTLTLDLTANTDFAQVEADEQVVNLTRFPTFFPEKRPFFLESSEIFDFGQSERTQLFHSRRIGLSEEGAPIRMLWGTRLSGRVGPERLGLLMVRTGDGERAFDVVARVKHDALARGYVGGMLTAQGGPGVAGTRLAAGADLEFPFVVKGRNLIPAAFVAVSRDSAGAGRPTAWRLFLDYPNSGADHFLSVSRTDSGFNPALGFVRQEGVWRYNGGLRFFPRPRRWGVRRFTFTLLRFDVSTNLQGDLDNAEYEIRPLGVELESGDQFELLLTREQDVRGESDTIFGSTYIGPGRYGWDRVELVLESALRRPVQGEVRAGAGEYYGGRATEFELELTVRLAPHFIANAEWEERRVRLPTGRFTAREARLRLDAAATPRLAAAAFLQWNNEAERLTVNARLHWIPRPGSDAYLVWNGAWPTDLERGVPWRRPLRGALVGKLVYYFRL